MYCSKCGKLNADDAVYCQKCGEILEAEEETRVSRRIEPESPVHEETKIFSTSPTLIFVKMGYGAAALAAILLVAFFSVFFPGVVWWIPVLFGLALLLIPAFYNLRQKLVKYTLTDSKIEIDSGLIARTTQNVPLRRIQDVTVSSTLTQRLLGFGDITIDNAGEDGGKIVLKNINSPRRYADAVLKQMRRLDH